MRATHVTKALALAVVTSLGFAFGDSQLIAASESVTLRGRVVAITDGDTLTLLNTFKRQHKIRLAGIDAPETGQPYGKLAKHHLSEQLMNREITVVSQKIDRYGRFVGKVLFQGRDVCLEQIRAGYAWIYADYEAELSSQDRARYTAAVQDAKVARRGLWAESSPQPPWAFRRASRSGVHQRLTEQTFRPLFAQASHSIVGNRRSRIYHLSTCPNWGDVSPKNRVEFETESAALAAGYRMAKNCS